MIYSYIQSYQLYISFGIKGINHSFFHNFFVWPSTEWTEHRTEPIWTMFEYCSALYYIKLHILKFHTSNILKIYMLNIPYHHFSIISCFLLGPCAWLGSVHVLDSDRAQFGLGPSCTNLKVFGPHPPFHQKLEDPINSRYWAYRLPIGQQKFGFFE